jgi:uncharacterized protein YndB with AHSA1/START domain
MAESTRNIDSATATPEPLVIVREFDAPREIVFKLWTHAEHLKHWWGPRGFTNPVCAMDARPGGAIRIDMRAPDGVVYPMSGEVREIVPPEKLVFMSAALDADGKTLFEILNTVLFEQQGGKTKLTLTAAVLSVTAEAPKYLAGMNAGWNQSLDRLAEAVQAQTAGGGLPICGGCSISSSGTRAGLTARTHFTR